MQLIAKICRFLLEYVVKIILNEKHIFLNKCFSHHDTSHACRGVHDAPCIMKPVTVCGFLLE